MTRCLATFKYRLEAMQTMEVQDYAGMVKNGYMSHGWVCDSMHSSSVCSSKIQLCLAGGQFHEDLRSHVACELLCKGQALPPGIMLNGQAQTMLRIHGFIMAVACHERSVNVFLWHRVIL